MMTQGSSELINMMSSFWRIEANNNWSYRDDDAKDYASCVLLKAIQRERDTLACGGVYEEPITCDCEFPEVAAVSFWHGISNHTKVFALVQTKIPVNAVMLCLRMTNVFSLETEFYERCEFDSMRFCPLTEGQMQNFMELFEARKL